MTIPYAAVLATGFFLASCLSPVTVAAQSHGAVPCGDRAAMLVHLEDGYSEKVVAMGLDAQGRMMEILAAPSGTWTMLVTTPGGLACLIASGKEWQGIIPSEEEPGA